MSTSRSVVEQLGLNDAVVNVVSSIIESDTNRFVREVETVEL